MIISLKPSYALSMFVMFSTRNSSSSNPLAMTILRMESVETTLYNLIFSTVVQTFASINPPVNVSLVSVSLCIIGYSFYPHADFGAYAEVVASAARMISDYFLYLFPVFFRHFFAENIIE